MYLATQIVGGHISIWSHYFLLHKSPIFDICWPLEGLKLNQLTPKLVQIYFNHPRSSWHCQITCILLHKFVGGHISIWSHYFSQHKSPILTFGDHWRVWNSTNWHQNWYKIYFNHSRSSWPCQISCIWQHKFVGGHISIWSHYFSQHKSPILTFGDHWRVWNSTNWHQNWYQYTSTIVDQVGIVRLHVSCYTNLWAGTFLFEVTIFYYIIHKFWHLETIGGSETQPIDTKIGTNTLQPF